MNSIADPTGSTIGAYNLDGSTIDLDLVTVPGDEHVLQGLATAGGKLFATDAFAGTVKAYNASNGAAASGFTTISGLNNPLAIAATATSLYVLSFDDLDSSAKVSQYDLDGTLMNGSLITGLAAPGGITVDAGNIYITLLGDELTPGSGSVSKFTLTGDIVNANFVTGLDQPIGMTLTGGNLYVANSLTGVIGSYNAATGATVNASLISGSGVTQPWSMANAKGVIYFTDTATGKIGSFDIGTETLDVDHVIGLSGPTGLVAVPEPHEWSMLGLALVMLAAARRLQIRRLAPARARASR